MKYLITGGLGFLGSNLSLEVLRRNENLFIIDNCYRIGSHDNLKWLKEKGSFEFIHEDIKNTEKIELIVKKIKPDVIFHVAGQVAMTTSLKNPKMDFETNVLGTFNILESVRENSPETIIIYSSTNKVYGDLEYLEYNETKTRYIPKKYPNGFDESLPLDFRSPYGCSKGAADQYTLDYARMFNLNTIVFRHSTIYGSRQFATYDQGWIGWFCQKALETKKKTLKEQVTISGNGKQVRDVLFFEDAVNLYFNAVKYINKARGNEFNIGGGIANSLSILELFNLLENKLDIKFNYQQLEPRQSDQKFFVANLNKVEKLIGWKPKISYKKGIEKMIEWISIF
ncbi:MAG: GDP-mannose 4,6-dehydratase [Candidatus Thorarchaeota archaeon]